MEKPLTTEVYVAAIRRALGLEEPEPTAETTDRKALRNDLDRFLGTADEEKLRKLRELLDGR